jgi:Fe-S-cluster containining protein
LDFTYPNELFFECSKCGICCGDTKQKIRHILLLESEANAISTEMRLSKQSFTKPIANKAPYCYEMKKDKEGKCLFLKKNQCSIYGLRPLICRFYPFEFKFDKEKNKYGFSFTFECPEIGKGKRLTKKVFEELFLLAQKKLP